jgi:hypothetical protein
MIYLCSCGFGTDDRQWPLSHLSQHPSHNQRSAPGFSVPGSRPRCFRQSQAAHSYQLGVRWSRAGVEAGAAARETALLLVIVVYLR